MPRPRLEEKGECVNVYLLPAHKSFLKKLGHDTNRSVSSFIREMVDERMKKPRTKDTAVHLDAALYERIRVMAQKKQSSISKVVENLIRLYDVHTPLRSAVSLLKRATGLAETAVAKIEASK